ncbi:MAG: 5-(carboxyamino)imidazole ribonucleotide synthase [Alphaproteobacteria bacterium]
MTAERGQIFAPGAAIGILGGGQLGRMSAMAAARLGFRTHVFTPEADSPAAQVSGKATVAPYTDEAALRAFARSVDVVTFEFENVPFEAVTAIEDLVPVRPKPDVLRICQDRLLEKTFAWDNEVATAPFAPVTDRTSLEAAFETLGRPAVFKTRRHGYDGKGQVRIPAGDDEAFWRAVDEAAGIAAAAPSILEAFVDFSCELSVIVARGVTGETAVYDVVENEHVHGILDRTIAPARVSGALAGEAQRMALVLANALDLVGLLAVEMFLTRDDQLLVNELAPRPHNSGHWTLDACVTSQFEQHVRAVTGLPLGSTRRLANAEMKNLIGAEVDRWRDLVAEPDVKVHLYGKTETKPGRKMGHVTRLFPLS